MDKAQDVLKKTFGFNEFRPLQKRIIENVLAKKDSLVVMPTGGGKSLCYQLPALIFEGLTIVISPLISLMKDQVWQLKQNGVEAALLNSSLSKEEYKDNFTRIVSGKSKILYIAPESLAKREILLLLENSRIDCLTIDEAHCISEWGHDFRPDYRQLGTLRNRLSSAVCLALTATATPRVQNDIIQNLNLKFPEKFLAGFDRPNLFLSVIPKTDPLKQTLDFLREHKNQPGIIYCFSRKQVESLSNELSSFGYSCKPYHAGLEDEERHKNQDEFIKDQTQIIIATIAFGMGINKSNVRFVIHYDLPKNIESYYQEIGRSGRDGLKADCLLLYSYSDVNKIGYFIDQKENETERLVAEEHLKQMVKYAEWTSCRRKPLIRYFGENYNLDSCDACDHCVRDKGSLEDVTIPAQKFLSAIKRTGEKFGAVYLAEILTGSKNAKILNNGHDKLSVYGVGKEYPIKTWQHLCQQFVNMGLISRKEETGGLLCNETGNRVLFKGEKVFTYLNQKAVFSQGTGDVAVGDLVLFDKLKERRKEIASKAGVPPYIIFSDATLALIAASTPLSIEKFSKISGVGQIKLYKYGPEFIKVIRKHLHADAAGSNNIKSEAKDTAGTKTMIIGEKYNGGCGIDDLVKEFNIKQQTVMSHLLKYTLMGNRLRGDGLPGISKAASRLKEKAYEIFRRHPDLMLSPVYEALDKELNYDELQVLRLHYLAENPVSPLS
ncbi:MAG: DNA helicase RecQ [Ignavibacteriaceae bacterium]|nr:DNA helicase RecQ [Ignavibacteriaceae bacterium]